MRKNQVSMRIERFGDQSPDGKHQVISIYADADSTYEALSAAFYEALDAIQAYGNHLPSFGRRSSSDSLKESQAYKPAYDGQDTHLRKYTGNIKVEVVTDESTSADL